MLGPCLFPARVPKTVGIDSLMVFRRRTRDVGSPDMLRSALQSIQRLDPKIPLAPFNQQLVSGGVQQLRSSCKDRQTIFALEYTQNNLLRCFPKPFEYGHPL